MARPNPLTLTTLLSLLLLLIPLSLVRAHANETSTIQLVTDAREDWPATTPHHDEEFESDAGVMIIERRSLFWHSVLRYYISYGALSANRIPCPPRSGRSYYTHNCYNARGPAHPYTRGCSRITRCRR